MFLFQAVFTDALEIAVDFIDAMAFELPALPGGTGQVEIYDPVAARAEKMMVEIDRGVIADLGGIDVQSSDEAFQGEKLKRRIESRFGKGRDG